MLITTPLPYNLAAEHYTLFSGKTNYSVATTEIRNLNNVFVTHEGLCLKNFLLVPCSHFNLCGSDDSTFYFPFWKLAIEQYLVSSYGKSLKKIELNDAEYLHIHTKWFGYFFWLTDCLPKLIRTLKFHRQVKLIYPENWKNIAFVNDTLQLFPNLKYQVIPKGVHMQVAKLMLPETRRWSNAIDPREVELTREFVFTELDKQGIATNLGEKIYISRNKAARRKPVNNDEVEQLIKNYGFTSVCMEEFSFLEQLSIMRNAKAVVGLHGAGLANSMFMQKEGSILELSPAITDPKKFRISFWRLANTVNAKFLIQFCQLKTPIPEDIYEVDVLVDLATLNKNLQALS
ncbi:MAG: glycosyltransferase family 61 protein [Chitinophagales bacterium]|nr:glycosyltransferase family 61 protein [Chitinophagales bacterium]